MEPWTDAIKLFRHNGPQQTAVRQACFLARLPCPVKNLRGPDPRLTSPTCWMRLWIRAEHNAVEWTRVLFNYNVALWRMSLLWIQLWLSLGFSYIYSMGNQKKHLSAKTGHPGLNCSHFTPRLMCKVHKTGRPICPFVSQSQWFKAKFNYASWFGAGSKLVRTR